MGIVYEAFDNERQTRVALKTLLRLEARSLLRLKNEFRLLQDIEHPNLVTLGELFEVRGRWFFTMELVEGVDFMTYVWGKDGPGADESNATRSERAPKIAASDRRLRECAAQLASGLHALHCAGCIHRDVKPSNAMVTGEGRVVLLDFGLVTRGSADDKSSSSHTLGTVAYMAPEQALSSEVEPAADWYSFGVLLYEALTGRLPYAGNSAVELIMKKQQYAPPPPRARVPDVPPDLDQLCVDLLRIEPRERPGGAAVLERLGVDISTIQPLGPNATASASQLTENAPFVGREEELRALRADFDAVVQGQPRVVTVSGESGLGKTALIRELTQAIRADREDAVVLAGRCYEREAVPYKAFDGVVDALSRFMRKLPAVTAAALLPANASLLPRVFPVLGRVESIAQAPRVLPPVQDPHELRSRVFSALKGVLISLAERQPLVVVIDDLQWADPDSLLLLGELLRPPEAPPLLLLMACRTDAGALAHDQLVPAYGVTHRRVDLGPLTEDEGTLLARLLLERTTPPEGVTPGGIAAEAQGHPLYIDELVRHVAYVGGEAGLRVRLDEAIWKRASSLPDPARRVLELIALSGAPLPETTMRTAAQMSAADFGKQLSLLRVASLARTSGTRGHKQIEPYHDRVRQAVLQHLAPADRGDLHERLALAIEGSGLVAERPQLLVRHLEGAGRIHQAADCAAESARRATRALAFGRAAELYRTALRLGEYEGDQLRAMRIALGDALAKAGHCGEAAEIYVTASVGADPGTRLECQRKAAQQFLIGGHIEDGLQTLRVVLGDIGVSIAPTPRRALASLLWQRLKLRLRGLGWRERHESQLVPEELKRLDVIEVVAIGLGLVDTIRGMDFQSRGLLLALRTGERSRVAIAFCYEACFVATQGRRGRARARTLLDQAHRAAGDMDDEFVLAWTNASEAMLAYFGGRFEDAATRLAESERRFRERTVGSVWELNNMRLFRLHALRNSGELAVLRRLFDEYIRDAVQRGDRYMETTVRRSNAILCLVDDDPAAVADELRLATWMPSEGAFHLQHWYELEARAQLAVYVGEGASAVEELAPSFERVSRSLLRRVQIVRASSNWMWARMLLAASAGSAEGAGTAGTRAEVERIARQLARERIAYATAWSLLLRAAIESTHRPERAIELLREAIDLAENHALRLVAAAARRRLGELLGGGKGAHLVGQSTAWMSAEGIVRPDRMARLIAPGF